MMIASSLAARFELFVASGTLAAHASCGDGGFRQRDVRFFIELFSNWGEVSGFDALPVQNTQVARYLASLASEGFARRVGRDARPVYRLTRVGLLELLNRLVSRERVYPRDYFFFLVFFIDGYRPRLEALVKKEGNQFPPSLRVELEALLDTNTLIESEIKRTQRDIAKLQARIDDAASVSRLARERRNSGAPLAEVVREVERKYPYELNSRKPLTELIGSIAPDQRQWELEHGTLLRKEALWEPQMGLLNEYLARLRRALKQRS